MTADSAVAPLGACPNCGDVVPRAWLLIEYARADGTVGQFAECPTCAAVVQPADLDGDRRSRRQFAAPPGGDALGRPGGETDG